MTPTARHSAAPAAGAALLLLAVAAAACSSGSSAVPNNGSSTPAQAAGGFVDALVSSNPANACDYVLPDEIPVCQTDVTHIHFTATGVGIGSTAYDGQQAIVVITEGKVCVRTSYTSTTACGTNLDPKSGLPASNADFASAYQAAINGAQAATIAVQQQGGQWYVDTGAPAPLIGQTGGTPGSPTGGGNTGPTGTTGGAPTGT